MRLRSLLIVGLTLIILFSGMGFPSNKAAAQSTCAQTHTVAAGQNLFRIGLLYGVRFDTLQAWNNIPNANLIYVGQVLCVSGPWSGGSPAPSPVPIARVVYPGNPFGPTVDPRVYFPQATIGEGFQLLGYNFPAGRTATISIAALGNAYVPYYTATVDSTGQFFVQVNLPTELRGSGTIAVLVTTSGGYFAKNWYYNR